MFWSSIPTLSPLENSATLPTLQAPLQVWLLNPQGLDWEPSPQPCFPVSFCLQDCPLRLTLSFSHSEWSQYDVAQSLHCWPPLCLLFFFLSSPHGSSLEVQTQCFFHKEPFSNSHCPNTPPPQPAPKTPTKLLQLLRSLACFTCWFCTPEDWMLLRQCSGLRTRSWCLPGRTDIAKLSTWKMHRHWCSSLSV